MPSILTCCPPKEECPQATFQIEGTLQHVAYGKREGRYHPVKPAREGFAQTAVQNKWLSIVSSILRGRLPNFEFLERRVPNSVKRETDEVDLPEHTPCPSLDIEIDRPEGNDFLVFAVGTTFCVLSYAFVSCGRWNS
ncbi:3-mercaptopyruvate sulfurtransferase [Anopheles sinensis]|uniref:3-mercaptopyruvate sulfurtransferase n=1 Tax=Anopheles sinensis TaxID=74873 RepID=A0A084VBW8_ANOSI|nr:3-mercaptopyruvate sulfurtransferase [Anopheles sinensis]